MPFFGNSIYLGLAAPVLPLGAAPVTSQTYSISLPLPATAALAKAEATIQSFQFSGPTLRASNPLWVHLDTR